MSRRIEIELTSKQADGTWTWRAAGAREPKGIVDNALVPPGTNVKDVLRAEVETDLDGNRVLSITPPKQKAARVGLLERLPSDKPFEPVTQQLRKKDKRDGARKGRRPRQEGGERPDRPRRQFFEAPPELPQRPKPKRVRPQRHFVDAVLAELPEAHRAIAERVLNGGLPAVRAAIEEQNKQNVAEGKEKIPADGLLTIAENLLPRLRIAEWRDKAAAAERIIGEVDVRDLRQIVVASSQLVAPDEETRAMIATMQAALNTRQEAETKNWLEDITTATTIGRVVRALKMSSQPPKAGVPFPPALAAQLSAATNAGLTSDAPVERWVALLEAAAFSPIRSQIAPQSIPQPAPEALLTTVTRLAPLIPAVAALFGIVPDPAARAPRPLQAPRPERKKKDAKPGGASKEANRTQSGKKSEPAKAASSPEATTPDVATPEVSTPEASSSEATTQEVATPDADTQDVSTEATDAD